MAAPRIVESEPLADEVLVERLKHGDEAAFEALYERYFKRVTHFVRRRIDNPADAEETVQEVFINVFGSIGSYRGEAPFLAWVFGLTRRTIAARFKRKRHPTVPIDPNGEDTPAVHPAAPAPTPTPLEAYECRERARRLGAGARRLSAEQRTLFEQHHLAERPIAEIARDLGKSVDAVKSNLYRTRKQLLGS